jgi:hypothetical protein
MKKKYNWYLRSVLYITLAMSIFVFLNGCQMEADVASHNLSKAADMFEVDRRIVFYNGITDTYMLTIEGKCSLGNSDPQREVTVTCKTGPNQYKKHFLGLSDNVTYFAEQLESKDVNAYNYRVVFRPETIIPDIEVDTSFNK